MSTQYPNNIDSYPVHQDNNNETISAATVNNLQDAIVAIENRFNVAGLASLPSPVPASGMMCVYNNQWYISNGTSWVAMSSTLSPATSSTLGGVKIGTGVNVAGDGTISVSPANLTNPNTWIG
jgi:hypothetical protein